MPFLLPNQQCQITEGNPNQITEIFFSNCGSSTSVTSEDWFGQIEDLSYNAHEVFYLWRLLAAHYVQQRSWCRCGLVGKCSVNSGADVLTDPVHGWQRLSETRHFSCTKWHAEGTAAASAWLYQVCRRRAAAFSSCMSAFSVTTRHCVVRLHRSTMYVDAACCYRQ